MISYKMDCDEWGGAESRGNGARPVEELVMKLIDTGRRRREPANI